MVGASALHDRVYMRSERTTDGKTKGRPGADTLQSITIRVLLSSPSEWNHACLRPVFFAGQVARGTPICGFLVCLS
jgi:hypothetical protein